MKKITKISILTLIVLFITTVPLYAEVEELGLTEIMTEMILEIGVIIFAARLGGFLASRMGMPSVLGELLIGIVIGPYMLGGLPIPGFPSGLFPPVTGNVPVIPELYGMATIASIILLFHTGLETDLDLFLQFSLKGAVIGVSGVILSFFAGIWTGSMITGLSMFEPANLFMGVLSIATSVGITARILSERRKMDSPEGVTILAAAVIDDVLGIIILAVVLGIVSVMTGTGGDRVDWVAIGLIALKAVAVWLGFTALGLLLARKIGNFLKIFRSEATIAVMSLGMAIVLAGIFEKAGLAMIIGAYVMGLTLSRTDLNFVIQEKMRPLNELFVPIFFCVMGMLVNVHELFKPEVILYGVLFSFLGIASKVVGCGVPSLFMNFNMRGALRIGVGMIPRGEVALIIGSIGIATGILNDSLFSIAIFMTLVTTVVTPPILSHLLKNGKMGTRTKMTGSNTVSTTFSFPSRQMTEMALVKIIGSMKNEGFFIHELDVEDHKIYQVRKDEIFLTFHEYDEKLEVVSEQANVFFVKTVTYESLLALHDTINEIKNITKPEQLKEQLKDLYAYRDNTVIDEYLKGIRLNCITMDLVSTDKKDVIRELLGTLDKARLLNNYTECLNAVMEREEVMTTGLGKGIAIPHAKTDGVSDLAIAVGIKKNGVDFQSIDGEPARVFVMMISPKNAIGPHLQVLSYISAMLHNTEVREAILNAASPGEVKDLLLKKR